ncbi:LysR family transcriptional regulator [Streptomyces sp. NPDC047928]|uniref:LysR family transcriptional regulator n=1 Tax=unclassified Streptomyces TaxID=2593676 RepID=UPI00371B066D
MDADLDLDLAQVRAFVAVAGSLHFGRAARELALSQQALSKRVARLEAGLGVRLLERGGGTGVRLTDAGRRFLEPARRALAAGDLAVAAAREAVPPLRIDVWGHLYEPLRTLAPVLAAAPGLAVETGTGRDYPSVAEAIRRGEVTAGLGRVPTRPGGREVPDLVHRPVRLEPVDAVVSAAHPLAAAPQLRPADLRDSVLRYPADADRLDFLTRFAEHFGVARGTAGPNLGLGPFLDAIRDDPACFSLFPADAAPAAAPGVRFIPLAHPTPLYAWSVVWSAAHEPPALTELLHLFARTARTTRWLERDPSRDWLPPTPDAPAARPRSPGTREDPAVRDGRVLG